MKRNVLLLILIPAMALGVWVPDAHGASPAQLGSLMSRAQQFRDLQVSDKDEELLGEAVSLKVRVRYGVVQDPAIHRYVSLVGTVLAQASSRPNLSWHFIVLDTDGVNAFAAPGGYIHITRGALALMKSENELGCVLAHELIHVTEKHTIRAIQKGKMIQMGANETLAGNAALFSKVVDMATEAVLAGFGRAEELEADDKGLVLANRVGYAPQGLGTFLDAITARNKSATQKQGLFASHPEMQERQQKIAGEIASQKLTASVTLDDRYRKFVSYKPTDQVAISQVEAGAAGLTGGGEAKRAEEPPKKKGFGLSGLMKPGGEEKKSAEVTGSGGSRGVDTERNAKGGSVATPVVVALTPADIAAFKKEGRLS
jgi:beta-barrel assembly-enhancing protease